MTRSAPNRPPQIGVVGPVGSGKTALLEAQCREMQGAY